MFSEIGALETKLFKDSRGQFGFFEPSGRSVGSNQIDMIIGDVRDGSLVHRGHESHCILTQTENSLSFVAFWSSNSRFGVRIVVSGVNERVSRLEHFHFFSKKEIGWIACFKFYSLLRKKLWEYQNRNESEKANDNSKQFHDP